MARTWLATALAAALVALGLAACGSDFPLSVPALATFQGAHQTEWPLLMAGNMMSLAPMLVIFFVAQRYFIRSVAATGLAGT